MTGFPLANVTEQDGSVTQGIANVTGAAFKLADMVILW